MDRCLSWSYSEVCEESSVIVGFQLTRKVAMRGVLS